MASRQWSGCFYFYACGRDVFRIIATFADSFCLRKTDNLSVFKPVAKKLSNEEVKGEF
jgi:hypothetical protein